MVDRAIEINEELFPNNCSHSKIMLSSIKEWYSDFKTFGSIDSIWSLVIYFPFGFGHLNLHNFWMDPEISAYVGHLYNSLYSLILQWEQKVVAMVNMEIHRSSYLDCLYNGNIKQMYLRDNN